MDNDDDVFSTSRSPSPPSGIPGSTAKSSNGFAEPSDIPRLRSQHSTVGYREGISVAKTDAVQSGFDEGYSLGAVIGLRVGYVLGVLEGFYSLLANTTTTATGPGGDDPSNTAQEELRKMEALVRRARLELDTRKVFGLEFLGDDAVWKWPVTDREGRIGGDSEAEEDVTFEIVADSHPLVRKWTDIANDEAKKLGVDLGRLEREFGESVPRGSMERTIPRVGSNGQT